MARQPATLRLVSASADPAEGSLDRVFFALSDPVRRAILQRLEANPLPVSELAAPFDISLQAVSRHIQVLVRAGLIRQERAGRISRCSLTAGPILDAAVWINRYSRYWQEQFDLLAAALGTKPEPSDRSKRHSERHRQPGAEPDNPQTGGADPWTTEKPRRR
jgi:DNA-binding transcriptional ArsR family regulator